MVMKKFLSEVKTDFIVETGDDDFLIIDGLKKLISFLRTNSDYSGVNGQCINIFSSKNINEIDGISFYEMCKRKEKDQLLRLKNHFKEYRVPNFSVFRKSTFKKVLSHIPDYEDIHLCPDREIVDELIQSSFSVIYTKIFKLKTLYLVRHITPIRQNTLQEIRYKDLDLFKKSKEFLESSILNALKKRNPDQSIKELINDYFHTNKNNKNNLKNIQIMYKRFINIFKFIFLKNIENNMDFKRIKNIILKFEMEC